MEPITSFQSAKIIQVLVMFTEWILQYKKYKKWSTLGKISHQVVSLFHQWHLSFLRSAPWFFDGFHVMVKTNFGRGIIRESHKMSEPFKSLDSYSLAPSYTFSLFNFIGHAIFMHAALTSLRSIRSLVFVCVHSCWVVQKYAGFIVVEDACFNWNINSNIIFDYERWFNLFIEHRASDFEISLFIPKRLPNNLHFFQLSVPWLFISYSSVFVSLTWRLWFSNESQ